MKNEICKCRHARLDHFNVGEKNICAPGSGCDCNCNCFENKITESNNAEVVDRASGCERCAELEATIKVLEASCKLLIRYKNHNSELQKEIIENKIAEFRERLEKLSIHNPDHKSQIGYLERKIFTYEKDLRRIESEDGD